MSESPTAYLSSAPSQASEQTELGFFVDIREAQESRGIYDATRLKSQRPEIYAAVARLLATGLSSRDEIARLCGVAWETVAAVEREGASTIREFKVQISKRLRLAVAAATDTLVDRARAGELSALDYGILVDKLLLIEGEATARVELVDDPAADAFRQAMAALAAQAAGSGMGLAVGNPSKGAAAIGPAGPVIDLAPVEATPVPNGRPSVTQAPIEPHNHK